MSNQSDALRLEETFPRKWIVHRQDTEGGICFKSRVRKRRSKADYLGRETFLQEVADVPLKDLHLDYAEPREVSSGEINILEYFGLLLPVAKLLVPFGDASGHSVATRGYKITSKVSWAIWSHDGKKCLFRVPVRPQCDATENARAVGGVILTPVDVDYWRAMRGLWPLKLQTWAKEQKRHYKAYKSNPFDMEYPLLRGMIDNANVSLAGHTIVPMYRAKDARKCFQLLSFLHRTLPLDISIMTWFESHKRTRGNRRKINRPNVFADNLWHAFITDFDKYPTENEPHPSGLENLTFNRYYYRNHYLTAFVHMQKQKGMRTTEACEDAANILLKANPKGEEPLSPEHIRKRIYYPTRSSLISPCK